MVRDATLNESDPLTARQDGTANANLARVLYLVHRTPYPPNRGDRIRSYHVLSYLAQQSELYVAALSDEPVPETDEQTLRALCTDVRIIRQPPFGRWRNAAISFLRGRTATEGLFRSSELARVVRDWSRRGRFDAVVACCSSMGQYLLRPELRDIPSVVDLIDVDSQKWFDYADASSGFKRQLYRREGQRLRKLESKLTAHAQSVLLVNEQEAELFRQVVPNQKTIGVANGVNVDYFHATGPIAPDTPLECVFVGVLDYRPNVDGLEWFCQHVWPTVRADNPAARLTIVGRNPSDRVTSLGNQAGVEVVGEVPDVRPYVSRATLSVAPLQIARGTQNKVLEAMAMGKAVVASPQALEGIKATDGVDVVRACSPQDWIAAIQRLHDDEAFRGRFLESARQFVRLNHDWSACLKPLGQFIAAQQPTRR